MRINDAPGRLELVREFLNTWEISNDTREPVDRLDELARSPARWRALLDCPPPRSASERDELIELRDELRRMIARGSPNAERLNRWVARFGIQPRLSKGNLVHQGRDGRLGGLIVAATVDAIVAGQWPRLKACADCEWVFYDWTRNGSRRWCGMNAEGPKGRACGSIDKVRRYRQRQLRSR